MQNNVFNESRINTVVVCAITSNLKRSEAPGNVLLSKGEGNLPKDSVANISQIITVNKSDLLEKIGRVSTSKVKQIIEGVKLLIEPREI
ncbi:MAG: type II toxin-antitoxin system PemK/MazF family toxin [Nitrospirae bacterium]|nr:type II toxin-antitoxin system PemK/MazF family toxin [Nitrospirota bacterium]